MPDEHLTKLRAIAAHWMAARRVDKAQLVLREILSLDPGDSTAMGQLSELLLDRNDLDQAAELAEQCVAANPRNPLGFICQARVAMARKDYPTAIEMAKTAVRLTPQSGYCFGLLAWAQFVAGEFDEALGTAQAALELDPTNSHALAALGQYNAVNGNVAEADRAARLLLQSHPESGFCAGAAAHIFRQIGLLAEGMRLLRDGVRREPANPRAHEWLAMGYWSRGDVTAARKHFREALRLDPRLEHIRQILRLHAKTLPRDMPEGWVYSRYVDRYDAQGRRIRTIVEQRSRPAPPRAR